MISVVVKKFIELYYMKRMASVLLIIALSYNLLHAQNRIITGAERLEIYVPLLKGKTVAVFANQTSMVGNSHLVDTLIKSGVNIKKIFAAEHGFRGQANAGEQVENTIDSHTALPVISLYGDHKKPTAEELKDIDIMIFDVQDVGVRFYTFINSLQYYMEAALENGKPLIILDRPNPNGFYIDGPVLDPKLKSFIGLQPIPIVYGMTIGEYALMIAGEKWLSEAANKRYHHYLNMRRTNDSPFHLIVIKCLHYEHKDKYELPVKPSPNLPEMQSIYLYPSICLFEGTVISEGRGTEKPFQIFGHPSLPDTLYKFIPESNQAAKEPKLKNKVCYGWNLSGPVEEVLKLTDNKLQLRWLIKAYQLFPDKENFFLKNNYFNQLAGNEILMQQIRDNKSEQEIRNSWEPDLKHFKKIRKKYLLYKD
jgi:uncharacterized protein YbbC (DUF1343 family)